MRSYVVVAVLAGLGSTVLAATSTRSVTSALGGDGQSASFDGRLYIVHTVDGWQAYVLRPEAMTFEADGLPQASGAMWSSPLPILAGAPGGENALAICQEDPTRAPFACDESNTANGQGAFRCYEVRLIDSDATKAFPTGQTLRRRSLTLRVAQPGTADAKPVAATLGTIEPLVPVLRGTEPTITRDGKLMVWNGSTGAATTLQTNLLMYSFNAQACAATGWTAPQPLSHMFKDPMVPAAYPLKANQLRASDGSLYADGATVFGAHPWLFPDGDAVLFAAALMPCPGGPAGCTVRGSAVSVIGAPTNWGLAHIDGGINPSTTSQPRLYFSSPGATTLQQLPVTRGTKVYPLFGSSTMNYVEVSFDDGLDGHYAAFWHMNESVLSTGALDPTRSPDVSGYFNTAVVRGAVTFPPNNNGVLGKAAEFKGAGFLEVMHQPSLEPSSGITMEVSIRPAPGIDCNPDPRFNNFRRVLQKGAAYDITLEEDGAITARVRTLRGAEFGIRTEAHVIMDGQTWTKVTAEYDGATGRMEVRFNDRLVESDVFAPEPLGGTGEFLQIGGFDTVAGCKMGGGNFEGGIDEVSISRFARHAVLTTAADAGADSDAGTGPPGGAGCCETGGSSSGLVGLGLVVFTLVRRRRRADRRSSPRTA